MSRCRVLAVGLMASGLVSVPVAPAAAAKKVFGKRPLHQGMRGRDVRVLQDYLTRAGFGVHVEADGRAGLAAGWSPGVVPRRKPARRGRAARRQIRLFA